jgi:hypothetical protein
LNHHPPPKKILGVIPSPKKSWVRHCPEYKNLVKKEVKHGEIYPKN